MNSRVFDTTSLGFRRCLTISLVGAIAVLAGGCFSESAYGDTVLRARAEQVAIVSDERIREASGIALSKRLPDAVWTHNDSGDTARLFLVGFDGNTRGVFYLADTPMPVDWEDMCSFVIDGEPWLLVGDVGDNATHRHFVEPDVGLNRACRLLLFREPELKDGTEQDEVSVHTTIQFEYEDGPHNCESVAVDVERGEILLVTKSKSTPLDCGVYTIPLTLEEGTITAQARRIGDLDIENATAMDISPDSRRMVVISYRGAVQVVREADEGWAEAIQRRPRLHDLPRQQGGESVCFGESVHELLLNSEHPQQPLWRVKLPARVRVP